MASEATRLSRYSVRAVDRVLDLLDVLRRVAPEGASLASLARTMGLPKSSVYRHLCTLEERGYKPQNLAGTSAGAITAALIAAGYSASELKDIIFGLDFPYNTEARTRIGLSAIRALGLSDSDTALILGGNLRRELGIN